MAFQRLILASSSPRRIDLFRQMGLPFEVYTTSAKEPTPEPGEEAAHYVIRASTFKAQSVQQALQDPHAWIIAADTIVLLGDEILGKPASNDEAKRMLQKLSGSKHAVLTGVTILHEDRQIRSEEVETTYVWARSVSSEQIAGYVATKEPLDKAGAYGIQGKGAWLVERIDGCYFNVVGLPIGRVIERLELLGAGHLFG